MKSRKITWLYGELPDWVRDGMIDEAVAEKIRARYGEVRSRSMYSVGIIAISIFAASLIGAGIILLLGHNWIYLSRPARTLIAFMPLVAGQIFAAYALLRRRDSVAWCEASATFLALSIGASISLIAQTYHIQGDMPGFLLTWVLLAFPLIYLLGSSTVAIFSMAGIYAWALATRWEGGEVWGSWLLIAAVLPHIWMVQRNQRKGPRLPLLLWALCAYLCLSLTVVFKNDIFGSASLAYSALFAIFVLIGQAWGARLPGQPFSFLGATGMVFLALSLTFHGSWHLMGRGHHGLLFNNAFHLLILFSIMVLLCLWRLREKDREGLPWCAGALLVLICYFLHSLFGFSVFTWLILGLFNLYLFLLGLYLFVAGLRSGSMRRANAGMIVWTLLFVVRFFDSDLSYSLRGLAFILVGVAFLAVNSRISRYLKREGGASV